jgi:uncharacterized protein (TIGR04222 family)
MGTWGISGPEFLPLYVVLLGVTVLVVVPARRRVLAVPDGAALPARLDRYEVAYLNGGCDLVATTAVSSLLRADHLGPRPGAASGTGWWPGRLRRPGPTRSSGPPTSWSPTAQTIPAGPWEPSSAGCRP